MKYLNVFRIVYLALLSFVIIHLILLAFGLAFIPTLWNIWLLCLGLTLLSHLWARFYKSRIDQKRPLILELFSVFAVFCIWGVSLLAFSFIEDSRIPITVDFRIVDREAIIVRGSLLHGYREYHDLVNPFMMKSEVKYRAEY
ncbi:hypothetical protein MP387_04210 [Streptococcus oralis]|uniref:hypothetical protein n=1 Tax=Streptococcus oralis TaxID=1303 RepID=UPI001F620FCA|nr:hypothetical protein [Streptococcus oralis]UNV68291.1 hypothetical protein MP387_04210 [Streptococcus oralis]